MLLLLIVAQNWSLLKSLVMVPLFPVVGPGTGGTAKIKKTFLFNARNKSYIPGRASPPQTPPTGKNGRRPASTPIDPKSTPNRPRVDPESNLNRPRIDSESTPNRSRIEPESNPNRTRIGEKQKCTQSKMYEESPLHG